jgi:hypothetical protein
LNELSTPGTDAQEKLYNGEFNEGNVRDLATQQLASALATSSAMAMRLMMTYPDNILEISGETDNIRKYQVYLQNGPGGLIAYL